jgi:hypothetical protein
MLLHAALEPFSIASASSANAMPNYSLHRIAFCNRSTQILSSTLSSKMIDILAKAVYRRSIRKAFSSSYNPSAASLKALAEANGSIFCLAAMQSAK